jgi:hypothetical protein
MSDDRPAITVQLTYLCHRVAKAVERALPAGFCGKIAIGAVDNGHVDPHDVSVEYRPPQPKAGMRKS